MLKRLLFMLLLAVSLSLGTAGCSTNPATGEQQINFISTDRAVSLGEEAAPKFLKQYGGPIPSERVQQVVEDLGQKMAAKSERPDLPWEFNAVNSSQVNAFALPGGKIFITRGLMAKFENMAQLAGVIGHEIGHVTAEHIGQRMSRQLGINLGTALLGAAAQTSDETWLQALGIGAQAGGTLYLLSFSRDQEYQSDMLGLRYMTAIGYNPLGQLQVMRVLKQAGGGGAGIEMLSTHPLPQSRIETLKDIIREKYPNAIDEKQTGKYRFGRDEYQNQVLAELKTLPPAKDVPKPKGKQPQQGDGDAQSEQKGGN